MVQISRSLRPFNALLLLFGLPVLLPVVRAFSVGFSLNTTQCGQFNVTWNSSDTSRAGPPFNLLLVPVNGPSSGVAANGLGGGNLSAPVQQAIPDSAWNATSNTGEYTIQALPFRTGEKFVVVMDDGFGLGTGGVSDIQTVGSLPGSTTCLVPTGSNSSTLFSFSSTEPSQCGSLNITTGDASAIRGFIPGGSPFSLELPTTSTTGNMTTVWNVNVPAGSPFVLVYIGKDGKLASSGLLQSYATGGFGDQCLANGPRVTDTTSGAGTATNTLPPIYTSTGTAAGTSSPSGSHTGGGDRCSGISVTTAVMGSLTLMTTLIFLA